MWPTSGSAALRDAAGASRRQRPPPGLFNPRTGVRPRCRSFPWQFPRTGVIGSPSTAVITRPRTELAHQGVSSVSCRPLPLLHHLDDDGDSGRLTACREFKNVHNPLLAKAEHSWSHSPGVPVPPEASVRVAASARSFSNAGVPMTLSNTARTAPTSSMVIVYSGFVLPSLQEEAAEAVASLIFGGR